MPVYSSVFPVPVLELGTIVVGGGVTQPPVPVFRYWGTAMSRTIFYPRLYLGWGPQLRMSSLDGNPTITNTRKSEVWQIAQVGCANSPSVKSFFRRYENVLQLSVGGVDLMGDVQQETESRKEGHIYRSCVKVSPRWPLVNNSRAEVAHWCIEQAMPSSLLCEAHCAPTRQRDTSRA